MLTLTKFQVGTILIFLTMDREEPVTIHHGIAELGIKFTLEFLQMLVTTLVSFFYSLLIVKLFLYLFGCFVNNHNYIFDEVVHTTSKSQNHLRACLQYYLSNNSFANMLCIHPFSAHYKNGVMKYGKYCYDQSTKYGICLSKCTQTMYRLVKSGCIAMFCFQPF